jgi:hypothetical protein
MTSVQFIYMTIHLLFVLHTTIKLHTIKINILPLLICLSVVLLLYLVIYGLLNQPGLLVI